ncbi:hypothetical protein RJT34_12406 [Clitoria ternatea]|uniref:PX domain-containing protein n=1 Tax=Clitoria ternatea TaxID=43366 RepID=A0AAN9JLP9_CLITE
MCSSITLFHDFSDFDFASDSSSNINSNSGLENFSLGRGIVAETNRDERKRNLRYGSSGLEFYGDCSDELAMAALDSSELLGNEVLNSMVGEGGGNGMDGFGLEIGEREMERGEEGEGEEDEGEFSEGEDSMYNYGSDGDGVGGNEMCLSRSVNYRGELEVRSESPLVMNSSVAFDGRHLDDYGVELEVDSGTSLLMNSSVAFGSRDLDDFLLQSGPDSVMDDLFGSRPGKNDQVEQDQVSSGAVGFGENEDGNDEKQMVIVYEKVEETKDIGYSGALEELRVGDVPATSGRVQDDVIFGTVDPSIDCLNSIKIQVLGSDKLVSCPKALSIIKVDEVDLDMSKKRAPQNMGLDVTDGGSLAKGNHCVNNEEATGTSDAQCVELELDNSKFKFDHVLDSRVNQSSSTPSIDLGNINAKSFESLEQIVPSLNSGMGKTLESSSTSTNQLGKNIVTLKAEDLELNEFYDEVVQDMEDILLESMDSPGTRLSMGNRLFEPQLSMPLRDGGLTASTSSANDAYLLVQHPRRIDRIEVVGARQKKGDVSFSERLVGVKEYTVYKVKVWSGKDQWEVERRYRDFLTLYRCMKALCNEQGWKLPLPWSSVEKETKIFRSASPDIIVKRSVLIQDCLQSILHSRFFSSPPKALIWFLSHQDSYSISPVSDAPSFTGEEDIQNFSALGKTISLIVEVSPNKSVRQLLEAQHHTCAGCHKHFDDGKTLMWDFVQTFGWGKPRLCEYTGQLFCSSCHTNETAVLPAKVLHNWDFTYYPVSQLAKSYLDSIHEQPMLCVTAVNPFLLSKIPALLHVMSVRKKIGTMLPYVLCPFRRSITRGLGNRRYLLESNDFFALRDLIDLSKGVFAALPVLVETVSRKILEHITDQCLICCDVGVPCNARQDCTDPSSLIFPFQEDDIERCKACQLVFHKRCFRKLANCPCGAQLGLNVTRSLINRASQTGGGETRGAMDLLGRGLSSRLSPRFLSGLFTKEKPEKTREHKDENIILMGSLPSTTL